MRNREETTPRILAVGTATPEERFTQAEILKWTGYTDALRQGFFLKSGIEHRHLFLDRETFAPDETVDQLHARFERGSLELGCRAILACLEQRGFSAQEIDFLVTTTCTGRLCPSLDTRFVRALGMRQDIQRVHVGDTGCASAVVALHQAFNYVKAHPRGRAMVVAAEICSAAYYLDDGLETAVANAIFADGAAATLVAGAGDGVALLEKRTLLRPEYLDLMGFTYPGGRSRILLSKEIRHVAAEMLKELSETMLVENGLKRRDIRFWVLHSAGRRVIEKAKDLLELSDRDLRFSCQVLRNFGNMSSATVLFVLDAVLQSKEPRPGDWGVLAALGPGFAAEGLLLRW
ncbi:MAG: type III polyketide synthase [Candidatus Methylomirabilales bacterium]